MKDAPDQIVIDLRAEHIERAAIFGACPMRIAMLETPGCTLRASIGEFLLALGNGWKYRVPLTAQRVILAGGRGEYTKIRPARFRFLHPFYVAPRPSRPTIWITERRGRRKSRG